MTGNKSREKLAKKRKARLRRRNTLIVAVAVLLVGGMILSATLGFADFLGNGGRQQTPPAGEDTLGNLQDMAASLEASLEQDPGDEELVAQLGDVYFQMALYYFQEENDEEEFDRYAQKGQDRLLQALEEGYEEPWAKLAVAVLAFYQEDHQMAEEYFELTLEADPENPPALLNYGLFLASQGQIERARDKWETVLELVDEDTDWAQVAEFYLQTYAEEKD